MVDCVIIGTGPASLAASAALTSRGIDHVVLERERVGQSWRSHRWDSLRLNNPGWMNPMLGDQPRDTYLTAREVVDRLERLAAKSPVREHVGVVGLHRRDNRWLLHTTDGYLASRTVVVGTGGENVPRTPELARGLPDGIAHLHSADYRSPAQLPAGGVVVVGSAQSGYQIAEEPSRPDAGWWWPPARSAAPPRGTAAVTRWSGWCGAASSTNAPATCPTPQ